VTNWAITIARLSALVLGILTFIAAAFGGDEGIEYHVFILGCFLFTFVPRYAAGTPGFFLIHTASGISVFALYIYWLVVIPDSFSLQQIDSWLAIVVGLGTLVSVACWKGEEVNTTRLRW
jgi:hypothetical protein